MAAAPVVVDASVAVKWYLPEEGSDEARRIRDDSEKAGARLLFPDLLHIEFANAIWAQKNLSPQEKKRIVGHFIRVPFEMVRPDAELVNDAMDLALELRATVYDSLYLALALRVKGTCITADSDFARKAGGYPVKVL